MKYNQMGPEVSYFANKRRSCLFASIYFNCFPPFSEISEAFLGPYHISQVTFLLLTLQPALS